MIDVSASQLEQAVKLTLADWQSTDPIATGDLCDLSLPSRVYVDFYVPLPISDAMIAMLEGDGWNVEAYGSASVLFLHCCKEQIWGIDALKLLTSDLYNRACAYGAGYDGWFIVSPEEDNA